MIVFQVSLNFETVKESVYSEENTCGNVFSTISIWAWTENTCGNESHEKETKHIHASAADFLHISIGNLDWCKCGHFKNEAGEIKLSLFQRNGCNAYCLS